MRIWSLHPKHLDAKGLVALWRETLLAKHVLEGKTKGYVNHPQLERFRKSKNPVAAINEYLMVVFNEAMARGYNFDPSKFSVVDYKSNMTVTKGQLEYEIKHLQSKLLNRDTEKYEQNKHLIKYDVHPLFSVVDGAVESWEIIA